MKLLIVSMVFLTTRFACPAQGQILFANFGGGVNAPITNAAGDAISASSQYVADLFWSTNLQASFDVLTASGFNQAFTGSGYFLGGPKVFITYILLVQVRVWDSAYGSNYYQARDKGGEFGYSNGILVLPDAGPGPPSPLSGLQSFRLQRLPRLTSTVTSTNTLVFSWPTEQTAYAVQQSPDLSTTNWTTLPNMPTTVGQNQQVILPVPPTNRMFYRLVSQ